MYWPVLIHNSCLLIILCGLVTISQATEEYNINVERKSGVNAGPSMPQSAAATASPQQPYQPSSLYSQQSQPKQVATTAVYQHGSGAHNIESISRNSYTMLSQAMSQAVSHEFSKWSTCKTKKKQRNILKENVCLILSYSIPNDNYTHLMNAYA